jgi:hypothetical protein
VKVSNIIALALGAGACLALYACGHDSNSGPGNPALPPASQSSTLAVGDVLAKAKVQSETDDPFTVNGGAITVTPTNDETSDPIAVNN